MSSVIIYNDLDQKKDPSFIYSIKNLLFKLFLDK